MSREAIQFRLQLNLTILATTLFLGTIAFMSIEKVSPTDALYFIIVTMATVGYGDIHPVTAAGKFLALAVIVLGVGTFVGVIASGTELILFRRERKALMEKLNLVVGVFFSEAGTGLLRLFVSWDPEIAEIRTSFHVNGRWKRENFAAAAALARRHVFRLDPGIPELMALRTLLIGKREFLVRLLENPALLEHGSFSNLLQALLHLVEELAERNSFRDLPRADRAHLMADMVRVYRHLVEEWLSYAEHLKAYFPYLFSLAVRKNPFDEEARVEISEDEETED